jgi:diphthamide synthase subunit DPH2
MAGKKMIVLCSSANFYEHVNQVADELEKLGFKVVVPESAVKMRKSGNYDTEEHRSWYNNPEDYAIKSKLMRNHFDKVVAGDAILVVNDEKRGITGYIGANALMEMAMAFYNTLPIYILNPVSEDLPYYEEVKGMNSIILNGDLSKIDLS